MTKTFIITAIIAVLFIGALITSSIFSDDETKKQVDRRFPISDISGLPAEKETAREKEQNADSKGQDAFLQFITSQKIFSDLTAPSAETDIPSVFTEPFQTTPPVSSSPATSTPQTPIDILSPISPSQSAFANYPQELQDYRNELIAKGFITGEEFKDLNDYDSAEAFVLKIFELEASKRGLTLADMSADVKFIKDSYDKLREGGAQGFLSEK